MQIEVVARPGALVDTSDCSSLRFPWRRERNKSIVGNSDEGHALFHLLLCNRYTACFPDSGAPCCWLFCERAVKVIALPPPRGSLWSELRGASWLPRYWLGSCPRGIRETTDQYPNRDQCPPGGDKRETRTSAAEDPRMAFRHDGSEKPHDDAVPFLCLWGAVLGAALVPKRRWPAAARDIEEL